MFYHLIILTGVIIATWQIAEYFWQPILVKRANTERALKLSSCTRATENDSLFFKSWCQAPNFAEAKKRGDKFCTEYNKIFKIEGVRGSPTTKAVGFDIQETNTDECQNKCLENDQCRWVN